jgi:hypothetical protein
MLVCLSLHSAACPLTVQRLYMRRKPDLVAASHHAFSHPERGCSSAASCSRRCAEGHAGLPCSRRPSALPGSISTAGLSVTPYGPAWLSRVAGSGKKYKKCHGAKEGDEMIGVTANKPEVPKSDRGSAMANFKADSE